MADAPPQGKYKAIVVCWVLGLGTLFAWNSIITISDYYYNLFPEYHPSRVFSCIYQPFALVALAVFSYKEAEINTRRRILVGYTLFFVGTFMLVIVDLVTNGAGGIGYFISTCAIVGAFGVAGAHVEGGIVGELSFMCPEFIQSFFAGMGAAGAFTSALRLVTRVAFQKHDNGLREGAMLFLGICAVIELLCVISYAIYFPRLPVVKYYRSKAASEGSKTVFGDLAAAGIPEEASYIEVRNDVDRPQRLRNKELFMKNIDYALDLFLIYVLTSAIFPGFLFEDTGKHQLGSWYPLVLVAIFNFVDWISRYIPVMQILRIESRRGLVFATVARFLFVPAFYFTAKYGEQGWMIMLTSILGLTNGYLSVCVMTVAPRGHTGPEQNALGNILVLCLLGGIFAGSCLNWLWLIGNDTSQNIQLAKKLVGTNWIY